MMDIDNWKQEWLQERAAEKAAKLARKAEGKQTTPKNIFLVMLAALITGGCATAPVSSPSISPKMAISPANLQTIIRT